MQVEGMIDLLYGDVPALFIIGCQVRDCHWGPYTNTNMSTMLYSRCLHVLIRLTLGYEHKVEYVRTLVIARLLNHHPWFSQIPGVPFSEEPCEAMLSRVVANMAKYPYLDSLEDVHDLFVPPPPQCTKKGYPVL